MNRIDEVVMFRPLRRRHCEQVIDRLVNELNLRVAERDFRISLGSHLRGLLVNIGLEGGFGGRAIRRAFQSMVVDATSDRILENPLLARGVWVLEVDPDGKWVWREEFIAHQYLPPARA